MSTIPSCNHNLVSVSPTAGLTTRTTRTRRSVINPGISSHLKLSFPEEAQLNPTLQPHVPSRVPFREQASTRWLDVVDKRCLSSCSHHRFNYRPLRADKGVKEHTFLTSTAQSYRAVNSMPIYPVPHIQWWSTWGSNDISLQGSSYQAIGIWQRLLVSIIPSIIARRLKLKRWCTLGRQLRHWKLSGSYEWRIIQRWYYWHAGDESPWIRPYHINQAIILVYTSRGCSLRRRSGLLRQGFRSPLLFSNHANVLERLANVATSIERRSSRSWTSELDRA